MVIGDEVTLAEPLNVTRVDGMGGVTFPAGATLRITRVSEETVWVRGRTLYGYPSYGEERSGNIYHETWNSLVNSADPNAPRPRKLGDVPEGGIAPDDPRLKWLWEDAAKVATQRGYCNQYDVVCNTLNIPGRPRSRRVSVQVGKVKMSGTFMATSTAEAREMFRKELTDSGVLIEDGAAMEVVDA